MKRGKTFTKVLKYALSFPEAYEDHPWDEVVVKVNKNVFAFLGHEAHPEFGIGLKLPSSHELAAGVGAAKPMGYGLGKSNWMSIDPAAVEWTMLKEWIIESYSAVAPKRLSKNLTADTPVAVGAYDIPPVPSIGNYRGAVHEFTITAPGGTPVRIRTVFSINPSTVGNYNGSLPPHVKTHPRGFWPYSDITVFLLDTIDVALSSGGVMLPSGAEGAVDSSLFKKRDDDPYGYPDTGNKGLYGVNANYSLGLVNSNPSEPKQVSIYFKPGGGKFWGAVPGSPPGIPVLNPADQEVIYFGTFEIGHVTIADMFTLAVGGGAATPLNRCFVW